jgi:two-component system response regulator LytT
MQILICDDDMNSAERCKERLVQISKKHNTDVDIEIVESGKNFLLFMDTKFAKVDLIYLDIHMPDLDGIKTAMQFRKNNIAADIVFYTVDDSHAIDGYDVDALHYIIKGKTNDAKFEEIFLKALQRSKRRNVEVISVSCAGEHKNIPIQEIFYFEVQNHIITVSYGQLPDIQQFEFYSTLSKLEEFLFGKGFIRIHKSYLVSEKHIAKKTSKQVEMVDGKIFTVGRAYTSNLK